MAARKPKLARRSIPLNEAQRAIVQSAVAHVQQARDVLTRAEAEAGRTLQALAAGLGVKHGATLVEVSGEALTVEEPSNG